MPDARQESTANDPAASSPEAFGNLASNLDFLDRYGRLAPTARVLEVGSGKGALLAAVRSRGHRGVGVDLSFDLLVGARAEHGALPLAQADATRLPFGDAAFDAALSFDVFEHIPDPDEHLREIRRVLAPGGVYLLQTPNKWTNTVFETIRWRSFTRWRTDHCSLHTFGELKNRLEAHGFTVEPADVPVVTPFFKAKVRQYLGAPGVGLLAVARPDSWPLSWRTNFYVRATKRNATG